MFTWGAAVHMSAVLFLYSVHTILYIYTFLRFIHLFIFKNWTHIMINIPCKYARDCSQG